MDDDEFRTIFERLTGSDRFVELFEQSENARRSNPAGAILSSWEALAVWLYTTDPQRNIPWHKVINDALWSGKPERHIEDFCTILDAAILKLPQSTSKHVYRGFSPDALDAFLADYSVDAEFIWPGYTSTAEDYEKAFERSVMFTISQKTGRRVGQWSAAPEDETEALIPRAAVFRVDQVLDMVIRRKRKVYIALTELDE